MLKKGLCFILKGEIQFQIVYWFIQPIVIQKAGGSTVSGTLFYLGQSQELQVIIEHLFCLAEERSCSHVFYQCVKVTY